MYTCPGCGYYIKIEETDVVQTSADKNSLLSLRMRIETTIIHEGPLRYDGCALYINTLSKEHKEILFRLVELSQKPSQEKHG